MLGLFEGEGVFLMDKQKKRNPNEFPLHMRMDEEHRNYNIDLGNELCEICDGTGNELLSMYHKCPLCNGTGVKK